MAVGMAIGLVAGCSGSALDADLLGSNADDGRVVSIGMGYPKEGVVSFSYPLVWNRSDSPLMLTGARPQETLGTIEVLGTLVGDGNREAHAADVFRSFPNDESGVFPPSSLHPLEGYVMQPVDDPGSYPERDESSAVIIGMRIDADDLPAAVLGVCVSFENESGVSGEKCLEHQLVVCEDEADCPIGPVLEDLRSDASE